MTYHIRHHTQQAHANAAMRIPVQQPATAPLPPAYEGAYAKAMRNLAKSEGRVRKAPITTYAMAGPDCSEVSRVIMDVIEGEMTPAELASSVSEYLGYKVWPQTVNDRLRGHLLNNSKVQFRKVAPRKTLWSAIPQHIGAERPAKPGAV